MRVKFKMRFPVLHLHRHHHLHSGSYQEEGSIKEEEVEEGMERDMRWRLYLLNAIGGIYSYVHYPPVK